MIPNVYLCAKVRHSGLGIFRRLVAVRRPFLPGSHIRLAMGKIHYSQTGNKVLHHGGSMKEGG